MKKILALLMAIMLVLSLAACGGNTEETTAPAGEETTAAEDVGTAALANGEWVNNAGKFAVAGTYKSFDCMGDDIHTGVCGDGFRNGFNKFRIKNRNIGDKFFGNKGIFGFLFRNLNQ